MPYAVDYVTVILIGSPFYLVSISMANLVRTDGNPRLSMWGDAHRGDPQYYTESYIHIRAGYGSKGICDSDDNLADTFGSHIGNLFLRPSKTGRII